MVFVTSAQLLYSLKCTSVAVRASFLARRYYVPFCGCVAFALRRQYATSIIRAEWSFTVALYAAVTARLFPFFGVMSGGGGVGTGCTA